MSSLLGKIIETRAVTDGDDDFALGKRLRALRELTGLSQEEVATKLGVSQGTLSRLECRSDINVSTVRHYVEALGATLKINAAFAADSPVAFRISEAFDADLVDDNQLTLPIFGEEDFRHHRDVVLSIKPMYSSKILEGLKTIELRRRFPINVPAGTIAYIYSTTPDKALVGFAEIDTVVKKSISGIWRNYKDQACITKKDFDNYFSGQEFGYALKFKMAKPFRQSIDLIQLRERFGFEPPQSFLYAKPLLREALRDELAELSH